MARAEPQAGFTPPSRPLTEREREQERTEGLVADYARAWTDAERMRRASLPVLPHQEQALEAAGRALDLSGSVPGRDLRAALEAEPALAWRIDSREGRQALGAAAVETRQDREALEAPARKAVRGWEALEQAHGRAAGQYECETARAVTQGRGAYAEALKWDPQLKDVLRTHPRGGVRGGEVLAAGAGAGGAGGDGAAAAAGRAGAVARARPRPQPGQVTHGRDDPRG